MIAAGLLYAMQAGATPGGMLLLLFSFGGLTLGAFAAVRILHDRRAGTLFGPPGQALRDAARVALPMIGLSLLLLPLVLAGKDVLPGASWAGFTQVFLPALAGLAVQISAEEVLFRGYLQQQLAARFRSPLIWMLLPSLLFGAGHYSPQDFGPDAWVVAVWATVFGIVAADLTARTGSLGAALGLHFATNVAALLFVGLEGNLDGLALWTIRVDFTDRAATQMLLAADFLSILVGWLIARVVLRV